MHPRKLRQHFSDNHGSLKPQQNAPSLQMYGGSKNSTTGEFSECPGAADKERTITVAELFPHKAQNRKNQFKRIPTAVSQPDIHSQACSNKTIENQCSTSLTRYGLSNRTKQIKSSEFQFELFVPEHGFIFSHQI